MLTGTNSTLTYKENSHLKPVENNTILSIDEFVKLANENKAKEFIIDLPMKVEKTTIKIPWAEKLSDQEKGCN